MRRLPLILLLLLAVLPGCRHELSPADMQAQEIGVYITCPGAPGTRAYQGDVPAEEEEYRLHSLQIWIFTSSNKELLYYLPLTSEEELPAPGQTRRYDIPVESAFARLNPLPNIDVFALANAASVGSTLDETASWEALNSAIFNGEDWFGVGSPVRTVDPALGLPMTGVRRNMTLSLSEDGFVLKASHTVEVVRAVSKIRYVFCRLTDNEDPDGEKVSIQKITLNGSQIPLQEYLFTDNLPYRIGSDYDVRAIETDGPAFIAANNAPEKLVYAGQNATGYEQLLNDAVSDGILTDGGVMYLRESDKALSGSISFTTDGVQRTRVFSMAAPGDFVRNHSWTLYGYFISGRKLEISINAIPWDYTHYHIDFSEALSVTKPFTLDMATVAHVDEPTKDHFNVFFKQSIAAKASLAVIAPLNGTLRINAVGDANAFIVEPQEKPIDPNVNGGEITVSIRPNPYFTAEDREYSITLSFVVEAADGREFDANTEVFYTNVYRFIR